MQKERRSTPFLPNPSIFHIFAIFLAYSPNLLYLCSRKGLNINNQSSIINDQSSMINHQ